ncbi:AAA family ATPase [Ensifer soli]|uniref:AAA family ATPase n=1 Tax=Ciceribacter sp. sgz301302 TaxID=3342379 RepID=UPI0035B92DF9
MLQKLTYSVTFPTGRRFDETVLFQRGFGAIVGANESGKSLVIEMIRFCLFGSAALRGQADDYRTLEAELAFRVKDANLRVQRSAGKAMLYENDQPIAVGIRPVSLKIVQALGFGLAVFDMACAANQNQLLELGEMRPAERQRAVDSIIGVSILDDMASNAGEEASALKRTADSLAASIREPIAPIMPEGYEQSAVLAQRKQALDCVRSEADRLRGWLANIVRMPVAPVETIDLDSATLQHRLDVQTERRVQRQALGAELARIPEVPKVTEAELVDAELQLERLRQYRDRCQFLTHHSIPQLDQHQIDRLTVAWVGYRNGLALRHAETRKADLLAKGEHTCPSCQHRWPIAGDAIADLEREIAVLATCTVVEQAPAVSELDIERQQAILDAWNSVADQWTAMHSRAPDTLPVTRWSSTEIADIRIGLANRDRRERLLSEIAALTPAAPEPDYAALLRQRQRYEAQRAAWETQMAEYVAWQAERDQKQTSLTKLEGELQCYDDLVVRLEQARLYEQALAAYTVQRATFDRIVAEVDGYRADTCDWLKVREALRLLRLKIKQFLVPSLNRVASQLLARMTGGDRQTVTVDEAFNITVDGQAIDTLSGSGKAVANLALRIGLGQVLTNNVFSVFIGDEIDASMDSNRSNRTADVLRSLGERISQLLLVSHKRPDADYYIAVGADEMRETNTGLDDGDNLR